MAHSSAGFLTSTETDHLIIHKQRTVEQHDVGPRNAFAYGAGYCRGSRDNYYSRTFAAQFDSDIRRTFSFDFGDFAFEIKRQLARHHKQRCFDATRQCKALPGIDGPARH